MNKFRLTRSVTTFIVVLFVFAALNYYMYLNTEGCRRLAECGYSFGFPFIVFARGTISHIDTVLWSGILSDITAALAAGLAVGWAAGVREHRYK